MATYGSTSSGGVTEATTTQQTSGDSPYVMVDTNLRRLLRDQDIIYINPVVKEIHRITERKIENLIAKKNQFRFNLIKI